MKNLKNEASRAKIKKMYQVMHTDNGEKNLSEKTKKKCWEFVDKSNGVEKI